VRRRWTAFDVVQHAGDVFARNASGRDARGRGASKIMTTESEAERTREV
jgi:hypothetical protein